ncbi:MULTISPECIES: oxepin-CoA hydrolase, alternative type [Variovorax]|jgi:enoyl-CoA hydratase/carnithine racemase|uniref:oxepin-CoA hydrolase, alternative type n=1 Tax=Variovorax TaxID=34072 RepID=UPI00285D6427|nr:enoyl-CoA hydratase [Variovorax sp. 3319]MDR6888914.1 enoyl-CoA hydratase/carnithine racemase [Variovorax sp. 3319]
MTAELKSTSEGRTMVLTIANPTQRNALGPEIYAAGIEALNGAESSDEIRSVVIVGEGAWFCAGGSLQRLSDNRQRDPSVQAESIEGLHNWIDSIRTFPKPIIAAVEGAAAGAGFSLALACDFVVAARDAIFAASYSNVALSPDGGLSWHLGQALPRQLASEWLMAGERIGAPRLHALGLVNELSENGQALASALALAARLNARAPNSLASIKELLSEARGATFASQLSQERDHFVRNLHHPNAGIGIAAFLEKKPPQYE